MSFFSNISFANVSASLILPFLVGFSFNTHAAEHCLAFIAQNNKIVKEIALNVSDALKNANICHTIDYFPEKRADYLFKEEKYDGFLMRDALFEARSPIPVVKIDPVLIQSKGVILSRFPDIKKVEDLNGRSIGIVRGWLWMELLTKRYPRIVKASTVIDLAHLLHEGRVDTILVVEEVLPFLKLDGYHCNNVINLQGHVFLKNSSKQFAGAVSKALKKHVENGNNFINIPRILQSFSGET
ncbi:MAG: hypothetical protein V7750_16450 [Sneathiella sp.]